MSAWGGFSEEDHEVMECMKDHFSAWAEYSKYIVKYREKAEAERRERREKEEKVDMAVHDQRVKETCMKIWKAWVKTNSKKARKALAEVTEIETFVGGMRYMRQRGGTKRPAPRKTLPKPIRKKAGTAELAQIVQAPGNCESSFFIKIATLQDRTMVEYSMQKKRWAPKTAFMRGKPAHRLSFLVPETASDTSNPIVLTKSRPAAESVVNRPYRENYSKLPTSPTQSGGRNRVWGEARGQSQQMSKKLYSASARPAGYKSKRKAKANRRKEKRKEADRAAQTAQTNQTDDQKEAEGELQVEELSGELSTSNSAKSIPSFDLHSSSQFRPVPPVGVSPPKYTKKPTSRQSRRRLRMQQNKLEARKPSTAADLEKAAELAAAKHETENADDEFKTSSSANYTVDSKPLEFNAKLSSHVN